MVGGKLHQELALHEKFKADLRAEFPDIDDATLHDTLEGMTDLNELIGYTIRSCEDDEAMIVGLVERKKDLDARMARYKLRVERKKETVLKVMEQAELKKVTLPEFTISQGTRKGTLKVVDPDAVPDSLCKFERKPDLTAIKAAAGDVPGTALSNGSTYLTVRKK